MKYQQNYKEAVRLYAAAGHFSSRPVKTGQAGAIPQNAEQGNPPKAEWMDTN